MMWNKLKQSLGLEKQQKVQAKPVAKAASEAQASSQVRAAATSKATGQAKAAGAAKPSSAAKDPKEAAFDLERDAVRASFQSDPQTVVAVIRAWLHEDSKQAAAPKEDAKPK
jgi:flagellar biosynthesis/type III secretory pathway M-ring protein FliF/YscJ